MSAVLEIPEIRRQALPVTVEMYHRLTAGLKTELLRGAIIQKVSKSPLHRKLIERLRRILTAQVEPEWVLFQEGPLTTGDSEPEPDLAVVAGPVGRYDAEHPATAELAVEVAVSSLEIDRVKAGIYAAAGVKEYWIVCPVQRVVEVYRHPSEGAYTEFHTVAPPEPLECSVLPGIRLDLQAVFA